MPTTLVFHFASGDALFSGVALILTGIACAVAARNRYTRVAVLVLVAVGTLFVALSSPPTPPLLIGAWIILTFAWLVTEHSRLQKSRDALNVLRVAAALCSVAIAAIEIPALRMPRMPPGRHERIYVVGDSISAGPGDETPTTWPALLAQSCGVKVINLARPGATLETARRQVAQIPEAARLVVLEIGGNDILRSSDHVAFRRNLATLLEQVVQPGRTLLMFELPLPPLFNLYAIDQRELAAEYGVLLIPKRRLACVLAASGATLDGLHLSARGHELMASTILSVLRDHVAPPSVTTRSVTEKE